MSFSCQYQAIKALAQNNNSRYRQGRSHDFLEGGFQIGSDENDWSKILTLRLYKTLALTIHKQKMPWLPLSERVYHFLNIYVFGGGN